LPHDLEYRIEDELFGRDGAARQRQAYRALQDSVAGCAPKHRRTVIPEPLLPDQIIVSAFAGRLRGCHSHRARQKNDLCLPNLL